MKKLYLSPYFIVLIVENCIAAISLAHIAQFVRETYEQIVGGTQVAPGLTLFALGFPRWFWLLGGLSILASTGLFVRKVSVPVLMHCLLTIAILDGVLLFFFALGIGLYFIPPLEDIGL
jgi:hypothetical protein